ncbi:MAG: hypothetical protein ACI9RO_001536 [Alteromonas macleodii]|jgi:hypothetical protein
MDEICTYKNFKNFHWWFIFAQLGKKTAAILDASGFSKASAAVPDRLNLDEVRSWPGKSGRLMK